MLFLAFGLATLLLGRGYTLGTAAQMGPGYFPMMLGTVLCGLGLIIAVQGLMGEQEAVEAGAIRPFLVIAAVVAFGLLIETAGLLISVAAAVLISSLAGPSFKLWERLGLAAVLAAGSLILFPWGLGLQIPVWPSF